MRESTGTAPFVMIPVDMLPLFEAAGFEVSGKMLQLAINYAQQNIMAVEDIEAELTSIENGIWKTLKQRIVSQLNAYEVSRWTNAVKGRYTAYKRKAKERGEDIMDITDYARYLIDDSIIDEAPLGLDPEDIFTKKSSKD